jgi:hypothetical protein
MHVGVMREGMKVELTIQFTQFGNGGMVAHEETLAPHRRARHPRDNSGSTWVRAGGTFRR